MRVLCLSRFWMYCNIADTAAVIQSDSCSTVVLHWVEKQKVVASLASKRKEPQRRKDERKPAGGGGGAHQLCKPLSRHRPVHKQRVCKHQHQHHEGDCIWQLGEARCFPRTIQAFSFKGCTWCSAASWRSQWNQIETETFKLLHGLVMYLNESNIWRKIHSPTFYYSHGFDICQNPTFAAVEIKILLFPWVWYFQHLLVEKYEQTCDFWNIDLGSTKIQPGHQFLPARLNFHDCSAFAQQQGPRVIIVVFNYQHRSYSILHPTRRSIHSIPPYTHHTQPYNWKAENVVTYPGFLIRQHQPGQKFAWKKCIIIHAQYVLGPNCRKVTCKPLSDWPPGPSLPPPVHRQYPCNKTLST